LIFILIYLYVEKIKTPTAYTVANMFKKLQLFSSAAFSVGHGGNDAQKVMGIPVSTTHTITGSIIGVGATKRLSAVRWGVTTNLLWAWVLTIPVSATLAAITYFIVTLFVK